MSGGGNIRHETSEKMREDQIRPGECGTIRAEKGRKQSKTMSRAVNRRTEQAVIK